MVDGGISCRSDRRTTTNGDDLRPALGNSRNERLREPGLVNQIANGTAFSGRVKDIRILGRGMVAPNRNPVNGRRGHVEMERELCHGAVVIETSHGGKAIRRDVGRMRRSDKSIRVGRVSHHKYPHIIGGAGV